MTKSRERALGLDPKDIIGPVAKAAEEQGWTLKPTKDGIAFIPPDPAKRICQWHLTTSDHRAALNFMSKLRQSGFLWPWPPRERKGKKQ